MISPQIQTSMTASRGQNFQIRVVPAGLEHQPTRVGVCPSISAADLRDLRGAGRIALTSGTSTVVQKTDLSS